ncbi:TVP38/TMEM64 family protein [Gracilibacillus alcaliphilus]|uniref:TVP38/TMEM64 family protein n=1 Tax=Gracilibacillus alcaliphilus TaxID=1401441 RepID=UPI00195761AB|nr:VTT domain-containing protein [Gracilibacillus alcaliphilus]MBM7676932.1 putative membrane protein YdjX (TVP38/TMEM64 family) [Gracilibacillus alcaliphilus]
MAVELISQLQVKESYVLVAPILFILVHLLRPILFVPVLMVCVTGGMLFGFLAGSIYSIIGLMVSSISFYFLIKLLPMLEKHCKKIEEKWLKNQINLNTFQIMILRMLPFVHFHLLSFCIYKKSTNFACYLRTTLISVIPVAIIYTLLGQSIQTVSIYYAIPIVAFMLLLTYLVRRKQAIIKWQQFFSETAT